ncbi:MAG TPA: hypothetical protein VFW65_31210 [Pseudonocardiaceae bacterium]|nr:hypothetical protein [Pseudonocardiaceae bacterium]
MILLAAAPSAIVGQDSPSSTDWIVAVTGIVALLAAAVAAVAAWRQLVMLRQGAERDQAAKFGMWAAHSPAGGGKVCYINGSGLPIYDVVATVTLDGETVGRYQMGVCGPTPQPCVEPDSTDALIEKFRTKAEIPAKELVKSVIVEVDFLDAGGIAWHRDSTGKLVPRAPSPIATRAPRHSRTGQSAGRGRTPAEPAR